jgi:glycerophosphoryl diester phosphodiesterase
LLCACTKDPALWETQNLNNNQISAFGHGGMGIFFKYPMDTYESFEPCMRIGADGTEMDVQMTKDSVLVLYHHNTLKDGTLCTGLMNEKNWSEIKDCLHASPYSNSINMLTATELLDKLDLDEATVTFDCKLHKAPDEDYHTYIKRFANALIKLTDKYSIRHKVFVESGDTNFLRILKDVDPDIKLFIYPSTFESGLTIAKNMNLYGITINNNKITRAQVKEAHNNNKFVTVWDLKSEQDNLDAIQKSIDFMQSDKLIHLLKVFGKYKKQGVKNFRW